MKLRDFLDGLRADLNDANPAGTLPNRWTDAQLIRYFNEGLCHVYTLKPSEYLEQVLIELEPGSMQKMCNCKHLHKILGQTDETGLIIKPLKFVDTQMLARWGKKGCPAPLNQEFTLTGIEVDPSDNGYFKVTPPVPPHEHVYIKALCANPPTTYDLSDLDTEVDQECTAVAASRQWVLYSALMVDDESQTSLVAARVHLQVFFSILQIQMTKERTQQINVPDTGGGGGQQG